MTDREKVIKGLETHLNGNCIGCPYDTHKGDPKCMDDLKADALALLKAQAKTINDLYGMYEGLCKEIREKYESDDVCGLCQYDGAYVGESGDWMDECPGFETNECFCMKNSIRKMCGQPLIEEP